MAGVDPFSVVGEAAPRATMAEPYKDNAGGGRLCREDRAARSPQRARATNLVVVLR
jgi:hypothetical protein